MTLIRFIFLIMLVSLVVFACATKDPKKMTRSEKLQKMVKDMKVNEKVIQYNNGIMPFGRFQMLGRIAKHACGGKIKVEVGNEHDSIKELRIESLKRGANSFFLEDCKLVPKKAGAAAGCAKKYQCVGRAVALKWTKADACKLYRNNYKQHFAMVMKFLKFSNSNQYSRDFRAYAPLGVTEFQSAAYVEMRSDELAEAENAATDAEGLRGRRQRGNNKKLFHSVERWQKQRDSLDADCGKS